MKTLFGGILLAIGILIAGASGLCSLTMFFSVMGNLHSHQEFSGAGMLPVIAIFGGIPFAVGLGLFFAGRALIRSDRGDGNS
jgi:hypothetical protein